MRNSQHKLIKNTRSGIRIVDVGENSLYEEPKTARVADCWTKWGVSLHKNLIDLSANERRSSMLHAILRFDQYAGNQPTFT